MTTIKMHDKEIKIKEGDHIDILFNKDICGINVLLNGHKVISLERWYPGQFCPIWGLEKRKDRTEEILKERYEHKQP